MMTVSNKRAASEAPCRPERAPSARTASSNPAPMFVPSAELAPTARSPPAIAMPGRRWWCKAGRRIRL